MTLSVWPLQLEDALEISISYLVGGISGVLFAVWGPWRVTPLFSTQGDEEIKSDIYTLFFHIVQRIPEYLIHLQVSLAAQAGRLLRWTISFGFQISNSIKAQGLNVSK